MPFFFAARSGNQELIQKYVIPFSQDRDVKYIGCWGVTEPQHGSDAVFMGSKNEYNTEAAAFDVNAQTDGDAIVVANTQRPQAYAEMLISFAAVRARFPSPAWGGSTTPPRLSPA